MTETAVELRNVEKVFFSKEGEVHALKETNLRIPSGQFFTLLGPSGCGKTTMLRLIAGFEAPTRGEVLIRGQSVNNVPPNERPVNTVFQNYALFPHMTVAKNIAFGLAIKRVPKSQQEVQVREALDLVQLGEFGLRMPSQLSGGQQQRVSLARALVNKPSVLLLDEPLGALDLKLRKAMQLELKQIQQQVGITFLYVTHDQEEALTMSDRIAVMNKGRIQQLGDPTTLYKQPNNKFVADFIGESNFITGTVESLDADGIGLRVGREIIKVESNQPLTQGQEITFTIRPEKIVLKNQSDEDDTFTSLSGHVQDVIYIGTDTRYLVSLQSGETVITRMQNGSGMRSAHFGKGEKVNVAWLVEDAHILLN